MSHKPQPLTQSFVVCRDIVQDQAKPTVVLFAPFARANLPGFPATIPLSLFIQLTGGHGTYRLGLQLQDDNGTVLASILAPKTEDLVDPVAYHQISWRDLRFQFPRAGRYALVLMADGEEIGRHALEIVLAM